MGIRDKRPPVWWMASLLSVASLAAGGTELRLVDAVKEGDQNAVRSLLKTHEDVNLPEADGATALVWASDRDDLEMVELLIGAGADVNVANIYGVTPLSLACTNRNAAMVEKLLKAGANPKTAQATGETPLMRCARAGNVDAVRLLLAHGADVSAKETEREQTALMWAAAQKHPAVVQALVEHGADVHARSARLALYTPTVPYVYNHDKDIYFPKFKGGFTPLMFAAQAGDVDSARILLAAGADVNEGTPEEGSALVLASVNGQEKVALFLLEKGADPNATDGYGLTAMHWALQEGIQAIYGSINVATDRFWVHPNMPELVKALLAHGANPNARMAKDFMPHEIHRFARTRVTSLPQMGLAGSTPFFLAAVVGEIGAMRILVEGGADPKIAAAEGTTPLMVAAGVGCERRDITEEQEKNFLEAVKLAFQLGGDVNAVGAGGRTALHGAVLYGLSEVIQFLAEKGANLDAKDMYGQTSVSMALGDPGGFMAGDNFKEHDYDRSNFRKRKADKKLAELLVKLGATPYTGPYKKDTAE